MLRLRTYKADDAATILSWCRDELTFRKWTSDRYDTFPITAEDMNRKYYDCNGDCEQADNFYPMTAFDENGLAGHFILRYTDERKSVLRIGFVIVDDAKRGMGYGSEMIRLALRYAFDIFRADRVTIGVFENNLPAYRCYKAAGFSDVQTEQDAFCEVCGEVWKVLEMAIDRDVYERIQQIK